MPSERFLHLPKEKQARVLKAAWQEFSKTPYDAVSINQIIQTAEIPRGSFYQYFSDKLDLLELLLQDFYRDMERRLYQRAKDSGGNVFAIMEEALQSTVAYGFQEENFPLFQNLFPHLKLQDLRDMFPFFVIDGDKVYSELRDSIAKVAEMVLEFAAASHWTMEELADVSELLLALLQYTICQMFYHKEQAKEIHSSFHRKLAMIQRGASRKETESCQNLV